MPERTAPRSSPPGSPAGEIDARPPTPNRGSEPPPGRPDAHPDWRRDEISLRELYLVLRRGLPLIAGLTLLVGAAAFVASSLAPASYRASATVQLNPLPVRAQGTSNLGFEPRNDVSFETYRTIALSSNVLEQTLAEVPDLGLEPRELRERLTLVRLAGAERPDQLVPLTVSHQVDGADPDTTVALTNAWATAALGTARATFGNSLASAASATSAELNRLQQRVDEAEAAWQSFQERDSRDLLRTRVSGLGLRITTAEDRLAELGTELAASRARQELLRRQLGATRPGPEEAPPAAGADASDSAGGADAAALELLRQQELLPEEVAAQLEALLAEQPTAAGGELITLIRQAELQHELYTSAGHLAEHDYLETQVERDSTQVERLRNRLALLEQEGSRLQQQLDNATDSYNDLLAIEPLLNYTRELIPTTARVLSSASLPLEPLGSRRLITTLLSMVVTAMTVTLFVFLREAVREPDA